MSSTYTKKDVERMVDIYSNNPCIETVVQLANLLNKPKKSIISKLVKEGVYITRGYRTKTGETPITKLQIVKAIEDALDVSLPDLDKAPKLTLKKLEKAVLEQTDFLEVILDEYQKERSIRKTTKEMLDLKSAKSDDVFSILDEGT